MGRFSVKLVHDRGFVALVGEFYAVYTFAPYFLRQAPFLDGLEPVFIEKILDQSKSEDFL